MHRLTNDDPIVKAISKHVQDVKDTYSKASSVIRQDFSPVSSVKSK